MAFADPQSVSIDGTAVSLPRTGMALDAGAFSSTDRTVNLLVRHSAGRRARHNVVLKQDKVVADPLVPSQNRPVSYQASFTVDLPTSGVSAADIKALAVALATWATAANIEKLISGES